MSDAPLDEGAIPRGAISTRTVVLGLVVGLPLSALFLWLAIRGVSFDEVWDALASANPWLVLLSVPVILCMVVF